MTSARHDFGAQKITRTTRQGTARDRREGDPFPFLLAHLLKLAGRPAMVDKASSRPWASALFEGRRHVVTLRLEGADAVERRATLSSALGQQQFPMPGHFVADICIDAQGEDAWGIWVRLSALIIRDW